MYRNQGRDNTSSALHDIVFLMAAGFFILFMVALWYVNPIAKLGKIDSKAEFIVNMEWPGNLDADIDMWMMDPNGEIIWFSNKTPNESPASLERDDLGHTNDTIMINGRPTILKRNLETITLRSILPGEYIINIHFYRDLSGKSPIPVTVRVDKLNPIVSTVFNTTTPILLRSVNDEFTIVRFVIEPDGTVTNVTTIPSVSLIRLNAEKAARGMGFGSGGGPY